MKANELRIGNLVDTAVGIIRIEEIPLKSNPLYNPNALHPITLTEEWLFKFGFTKSKLEGYDVHFKYSHPKLYSSITAIYNADYSLKLDGVARGIKYIHQLQNLYFALTGEEL